MNQSEFEADTCNWRQTRENVCGQNTIGFGLDSHWLKSGASFVNQSQNVVMQNQRKREITFDTQLKTALTHDIVAVLTSLNGRRLNVFCSTKIETMILHF